MDILHINPVSLHRSPAFSQGVMVTNPGKLLVVGGQNGTDATGQLVGDDLGSQTKQALRNVLEVLKAAGAEQQHVLKLTIYLAAGQSAEAGFEASREVWGFHPTAVSVLYVAAIGRPGTLVEIEALAVVP
ncbi:MAG: RidA family protein [Anaerolineae bacterium]